MNELDRLSLESIAISLRESLESVCEIKTFDTFESYRSIQLRYYLNKAIKDADDILGGLKDE